jgi:hypothetical protein
LSSLSTRAANTAVDVVGVVVCSPAPGERRGTVLLMSAPSKVDNDDDIDDDENDDKDEHDDDESVVARLELTMPFHATSSKSLRAGVVCALIGIRVGSTHQVWFLVCCVLTTLCF